MIRHAVIFTCKPGIPEQSISSAIESAKKVLPGIPVVRSFTIGRDLGLQPGKSGEIAVVADFDSIEDWRTYLNHEVHLDYIKNDLAPITDTRISVQFEI